MFYAVGVDLKKVGAQIRALRSSRGMTIQRLSTRSGVSASMISAIERGTKAPTIVVLDLLAASLGTTVGGLLGEAERPSMIVRRRGEQDVVIEDGWERTILSPVVPGVNFEWIQTTLPTNTDPGEFPAYATGSHTFLFVQAGQLTLTVGAETITAEAGDSIYFEADMPHRYANEGSTQCSYFVAALNLRARSPKRS